MCCSLSQYNNSIIKNSIFHTEFCLDKRLECAPKLLDVYVNGKPNKMGLRFSYRFHLLCFHFRISMIYSRRDEKCLKF